MSWVEIIQVAGKLTFYHFSRENQCEKYDVNWSDYATVCGETTTLIILDLVKKTSLNTSGALLKDHHISYCIEFKQKDCIIISYCNLNQPNLQPLN